MTIEEIFAGESDNLEFKEDIPAKSEKYMKTVVAFANGSGGRIVFGVENNTWNVIGFTKEEVFRKMDAITNAIYDSCDPKISPSVGIQDVDGMYIIVVDVPSGMQRPYCLKSQGMLDGVYLRVAGTTRKAARYKIQEMILEAGNRSFDQQRVERELSEQEIERFCDRLYHHAKELCNTDADKASMKKIGRNQLLSYKLVLEENGKYYATNGYQLIDGKLDGYSGASIQCAVFKGTVRNIFITRKEFKGSIDEQIESAYAFVLEHINLGARIDGLARQDIYELPIRTIREIITNAVCHRSYLSPDKIQVALFDDRLEITSPGMLDHDLTIEKMKTGLSKVRNKAIAEAFAYMNLIEAWGSGIPKMYDEAKAYGLPEPELIDLDSDFRVNFYRRTMEFDQHGVVDPTQNTTQTTESTTQATQGTTQATQDDTKTTPTDLSEEDKAVLDLIRKNPSMTQKVMAMELDWKVDRVKYYLNKLKKNNVIQRVGSSQKGYWNIL